MKAQTVHSFNCPLCGPSAPGLVYDPNTDETVCRQCGAVLENPPASSFLQLGDVAAGNQNTPTQGQELGGHMGSALGPAKDAGGRVVEDPHGIRRQRKWQQRTARRAGGTSDSHRAGASLIRTLADKLSLPVCVISDATVIYNRACKMRLPQGRTVAVVAAASVMMAARRAGLPRRASEIEEAVNVHNLAYHYRVMCRRMDMSPPPPNPDIYVTRTVSTLALPAAAARRASDILARARTAGATAGRNPAVLASAAILIASAVLKNCPEVSADTVASAAGVSPASSRQCAAALRAAVIPEACGG